MGHEWRWILVAMMALAIGVIGAKPYARLAAPYYAVAARWIALGHPWEVVNIEVAPGSSGRGAILRLTGTVRNGAYDSQPAAKLISKLQVASVVESPVVFWTLLILWPLQSRRERLWLLALGIPVFLCLETATTVCQLLNPLAYGSAVLAGVPDPLTWWERWSRFLEAGGRVVLALAAALITITIMQLARRRYGKAVLPPGHVVVNRLS
jgi:hypothetical protein